MNPTSLSGPAFGNVDIVASRYIPRGKVMMVGRTAYFPTKFSRRRKWRRPHGRTNGPRRMKERQVRYQPELDSVLAMTRRT